MPKVSWGTDKAKRNREGQVGLTPRNDSAKKVGSVVRGTQVKVNPKVKTGRKSL